MPQTFVVKQQHFEGPLELLLDLIEKRKLFINDISLAKVTDDYIGYIQNTENITLAENAHFILTAATLVLIKSRSLLPNLELSEEEKYDVEELERRLKIYKLIREKSSSVKEIFGKNILYAIGERGKIPVFAPHKRMTLPNIISAMKDVLQNLPKTEFLPKTVVKKIMSLQEMIESLTKRISSNLKMSFKEFTGGGKEEKINIIISFLAMLELVKRGLINARQEKHFEDIVMENETVELPRYGA